MRLRRLLAWLFGLPLAAVALWIALAYGAAAVPGPGDRGAPDGEIEIGVVSNGWHTSLVLPVFAAGVDWSAIAPAPRLGPYTHVLLGWGDRDFYMNTRTLSDLRPATAMGAIFSLGGSVFHVDRLSVGPGGFRDAVRLRLTPERYRALAVRVQASLAPGPTLHPGRGYGPSDDFYDAVGRYSFAYTCNEWTADALRAAGVSVPVWAPLAGPLMDALRRPTR